MTVLDLTGPTDTTAPEEVVAAADARKKTLAASYRQDIRLVPALQAEYDTYDPGWSRW